MSSSIEVGEVVGSYVVEERLGEGGMATVYAARHRRIGLPAAIKVLRPELLEAQGANRAGRSMVDRFLREAKLLSRVRHDNVVSVLDYGRTRAQVPCLVMEHLEGITLEERLAQRGPLPWDEVMEMSRQVLAALGAIHRAGIVHRDLKPENCVLVDVEGERRLKVIDFGVATSMRGTSPRITHERVIIGTPCYMAPEQARTEPVDERTDLYAVGILLFEMLAGRPPFVAKSPAEVVSMQLHDAPPGLFRVHPNADAPRSITRVIQRALAKRPERRYSNAAEMLEDLEAVDADRRAGREKGDSRRPGDSRRGRVVAVASEQVTPVDGLGVPEAVPVVQTEPFSLHPLGTGREREWSLDTPRPGVEDSHGPQHLARRPGRRRVAIAAGVVAVAASITLWLVPSAMRSLERSMSEVGDAVARGAGLDVEDESPVEGISARWDARAVSGASARVGAERREARARDATAGEGPELAAAFVPHLIPDPDADGISSFERYRRRAELDRVRSRAGLGPDDALGSVVPSVEDAATARLFEGSEDQAATDAATDALLNAGSTDRHVSEGATNEPRAAESEPSPSRPSPNGNDTEDAAESLPSLSGGEDSQARGPTTDASPEDEPDESASLRADRSGESQPQGSGSSGMPTGAGSDHHPAL